MAESLWDVLECKWTRQIIDRIAGESARFNEIERTLDVPTSTLSNRLKQLERTGMVSREVEDDSPPSVSYSLTEKGERLAALIEEIDALA